MSSEGNLKKWISHLNLPSSYADGLIKEGFDDIDILTEITMDDLNECGITKRGHQKKILKFAKNFEVESVNFKKESPKSQRRSKPLPKVLREKESQTLYKFEEEIPEEIKSNEVMKTLFYFVKKCIVLVKNGSTRELLSTCFHPVDILNVKKRYSISFLKKLFDEKKTNVSSEQMLELMNEFLAKTSLWRKKYVGEALGGSFRDRYGGKFFAYYSKKGRSDHMQLELYFRHFQNKWYLCNFRI